MDKNASLSFFTNDAFREIFQSMSEGILMVDEDGMIIVANPVAEQIFGYQPNELAGVHLDSLIPDRYRGRHEHFRKGFNAHPEPRRMGAGRDLMALRKDGREFPVEISLSYTQVKGKLLVMAFISDISQRKKAEEALRKSEEQLIVYAAELEKKVQSRTEALHKTIKELENEVIERKRAEDDVTKALERERELNELKSKFVSIASHEFRTPLSAVLSSASLISQYNERGEDDKVDKHVQRIRTSVNHLTTILNDFLSLGKLEEGVVSISRQVIHLDDFVQSIVEDMQHMLKEGQRIHVSMETPLHEVVSDLQILRNILFNLISNASKYSATGKNIWLKVTSTNQHFVFNITDEGIGISKEDQKHLFERFYRASNAGNIQGTGLGLNIVKRYVELLKGTISFKSEFEKGSTFSVSIPLI